MATVLHLLINQHLTLLRHNLTTTPYFSTFLNILKIFKAPCQWLNLTSYHLTHYFQLKEPILILLFEGFCVNLTQQSSVWFLVLFLGNLVLVSWILVRLSRNKITFPIWKFLDAPFHLALVCSSTRNSFHHLDQNILVMCYTCHFLLQYKLSFSSILGEESEHWTSWSIYCWVK